MAKRGDCIYYPERRDFRNVVLEEVLKIWSEKAGVELVSRKKKGSRSAYPKMRNSGACLIAVADTLDITCLNFIEEVFGRKKENLLPVVGGAIKPLYLFLDEEVELYAKLLKLKFNKNKERKNKLADFINSLEKNHPEVKRAVVNSYLELFYN